MPVDPDRLVIGVFGSKTDSDAERDAVELIARAIHEAGAIVLSGAEPPLAGYTTRPVAVKDLAVYGLRGVPDWPSATWVGVANHKDAREPVPHGNSGIVVTPGWRDRRNFVEAAMCDAAVAVGGTTPGTASEALFCLYFGRPLALVVDGPAELEVTARDLRDCIKDRVASKGDRRSVDIGVAGAFAWAETTDKSVTTSSLPTSKTTANELVTTLVESASRGTPRTSFDGLADKDSWDAYLRAELQAASSWPADHPMDRQP